MAPPGRLKTGPTGPARAAVCGLDLERTPARSVHPMPDTLSVAVLGTGIMGAAMARNLARAGLDVSAWNRTRARAEPLSADGVRVTDTPAQAVDGADVVLTMLLDGPAVLDALRQAAPALPAGAVWLVSLADCSYRVMVYIEDVAEFAHDEPDEVDWQTAVAAVHP